MIILTIIFLIAIIFIGFAVGYMVGSAHGFNDTLLKENEDSILPICYQKEIMLDWCYTHYGGINSPYGEIK